MLMRGRRSIGRSSPECSSYRRIAREDTAGHVGASSAECYNGPRMSTYDPHTALIVVDVQNDFADPKGSLYVQGGEDVVAVANGEIERALEAGATVVYTSDWHPEVTPHFQKDGGIW